MYKYEFFTFINDIELIQMLEEKWEVVFYEGIQFDSKRKVLLRLYIPKIN